MRKRMVIALVLAAAAGVRAQDEGRPQGRGAGDEQAPGDGRSDLFERACIDLLHGRTPEGEKAIESLRKACDGLLSSRADERIQAEQRRRAEQLAAEDREGGRARVEAGRGTRPASEGRGVLAAFDEAAKELGGPARSANMGFRRSGPVGTTIVTNPIGWFNGIGVNAELYRTFEPRLSWVAGARYSTTDATNGTASTFGLMGGIDLFLMGRNNEGLRIGPRVELAAGREEFQGDTTFARLGLAGEVGYNFIATNGLTATVSGGFGGRIAGDERNEDFASFVGGEFGPYVKLGLGWSW